MVEKAAEYCSCRVRQCIAECREHCHVLYCYDDLYQSRTGLELILPREVSLSMVCQEEGSFLKPSIDEGEECCSVLALQTVDTAVF